MMIGIDRQVLGDALLRVETDAGFARAAGIRVGRSRYNARFAPWAAAHMPAVWHQPNVAGASS